MNKTKIEWVKNPDGTQGYTWNPITGCLNGCEYCYARKLANGRLKSRYLANKNYAPIKGISDKEYKTLVGGYSDPFYPRFWPERLGEPQSLGGGMFGLATIPKGIFVCDMSDLFGIGIPQDWTKQIMAVIEGCPQHRFYLLTKQPQNLISFFKNGFPDNCWVGVTATGEIMFDTALEWLGQIQAVVKYISLEPYLERINPASLSPLLEWAGISQVIIGSQTKPYKPPEMSWIEEMETAARKAGIAIFEKDNLKLLLEGELIQEMPTTNV